MLVDMSEHASGSVVVNHVVIRKDARLVISSVDRTSTNRLEVKYIISFEG
jgi:hypothetical protein